MDHTLPDLLLWCNSTQWDKHFLRLRKDCLRDVPSQFGSPLLGMGDPRRRRCPTETCAVTVEGSLEIYKRGKSDLASHSSSKSWPLSPLLLRSLVVPPSPRKKSPLSLKLSGESSTTQNTTHIDMERIGGERRKGKIS